MVTGVAQTWHRSGHQAPLVQRWDAAVSQLQKLSPGASVGGPISELGLDAITEQINRLTRPPAEPDPAMLAASRELTDLERRYHSAWISIKELQKKLRNAADRPEHKILGDVPANALSDIGPPVDMSVGRRPFHNAREMRREVEAFLPRVLAIEALHSQLSAALAVDHNDNSSDGLDRRLIYALADRIEALEEKIEVLEQKAPAASARDRAIAAIVESPSRSDRAIADELGIGKDTVRRARKLTGAK